MRAWLTVLLIAVTLIPSALAADPLPTLPAPHLYAFPASWVAQKQIWVRKYWPGAGCRGRVPVTLVDGSKGFRFIECIAELDNPPTVIWFRINSSGHVVMDVRLKT